MKNSKKILKLVTAEATELKKTANEHELSNLNYNTLNPTKVDRCIYGQMTGDCFGFRATELIEKCCKIVIEDKFQLGNNLISNIIDPKKSHRINYYSPIEEFIYNGDNEANGNNERLIDFLKGKTDKLELSL